MGSGYGVGGGGTGEGDGSNSNHIYGTAVRSGGSIKVMILVVTVVTEEARLVATVLVARK